MDSQQEYLSRPLLEGVVYQISDDHVSICSRSTGFIDARMDAPLKKEDLLAQYSQVLRMAREKGAKISYTSHVRRIIRKDWKDYEAAFHRAQCLFRQLAAQARVIEQRGIHYGYRDDPELERLDKLNAQFQAYGNLNSVISRMVAAKHHMNDVAQFLSGATGGGCMISL